MCQHGSISLPSVDQSYNYDDETDTIRSLCREALRETGEYGCNDANNPVVSLALQYCADQEISIDRHDLYLTILDVAEICDIEID